MYVRVFAAAWLLACAGLALLAWGFEAPFAYDPVGPRAYPLLLLLLMACGAAWLLFKPHGEPTPPFDRPKAQRAVLCVLALLAYALLRPALTEAPLVWGAALSNIVMGLVNLSMASIGGPAYHAVVVILFVILIILELVTKL